MIPQRLKDDARILEKRGHTFRFEEGDEGDGPVVYVVFDCFPLPPGAYNLEMTTLMIRTGCEYPNHGFDMFWTDPGLTLKDGSEPASTGIDHRMGRDWRMFSYHPYKPWNPAVHNVGGFMRHVQARLGQGD